MSRSSLLGIDRPNPRAPGNDDAALGPSDSSDSGDTTGLDAPEPRGEDESADPVGDGHADAALAASLPPQRDRPKLEPDRPEEEPPLTGGRA